LKCSAAICFATFIHQPLQHFLLLQDKASFQLIGGMIAENIFHHPQLLQESEVLASMYCPCLTGKSVSRNIKLIRPRISAWYYTRFYSKPYELICVRATPLVRQNGFGPAFLLRLLRLVEGTAKTNTCQRKITHKW
jgi:hypothetical protein